jgi:hypothetical protein
MAAAASVLVLAFCVLQNAAIGQVAEGLSLAVYRKAAGTVDIAMGKGRAFQLSDGAEPVTGDFDGDGRPDAASFDPATGLWTVLSSSNRSTLVVAFRIAERKVPIRPEAAPADLDGDGETDPMVFCAGVWYVYETSKPGTAASYDFGMAGDVPVPADYDGDGKADLAVFRPAENRWYIQGSRTGTVTTHDFGIAGSDILLPADYTGDGRADLAVYRSGVWHILDREANNEETFEFGFTDAKPLAADMNNDGRVDMAVFRNGAIYVFDGSSLYSRKFGSEGDIPLSFVTASDTRTTD